MRYVLRLWATSTTLAGIDSPFFIGTVEQQQGLNIAGLIPMVKDSGAYDRSLHVMERTLGDRFAVKRVQRANQETQAGHEQRNLHWRGDVLLIWGKGG